ncbi:DNA circularization protein [Sansalvadorimonas verongulae]|uniref:DNA circularization protein n=1 Tax=Sansalvadorimonas verongulae TaxID=2172824 RepID=UPI0012BC5A73|nr:DNA circularization N-terminal domain-containing protein [Sansalvadorimonas verongulae]MTI13367.1 hypothetical protein [Sansalvadorimonas verongulae]
MSWRDRYQPARFRGVPFHIRSHNATGGRNTDTSEFFGVDDTSTEDTGQQARQYSVDAYVLGAEYFSLRDALLSAIQKEGAADLVHPYLGTLKVLCKSWSLRESSEDGGMARFALTFVEEGEQQFPAAQADRKTQVGKAAEAAEEASARGFAENFSLDGVPGFVSEDAVQMMNDVAGYMSDASARLGNPMFAQPVNLGHLASPYSAAKNLYSSFKQLSSVASRVAANTGSSASSTGSTGSQRSVLSELSTLASYDTNATAIAPITASRQRQISNRLAIQSLVQEAAVITSADVAVQTPFESTGQSESARDQVLDNLDEVAEVTPSDEVFTTLQDLRKEVYQALPDKNLPQTGEYTPPVTLPALVAGYELYRNPEQGDDIARRNHVTHPGFLPGGEPLEVLTG